MSISRSVCSWLLVLGIVGAFGRFEPGLAASPLSGPLRVHPSNPRYFTDGTGRAIYLTGAHTWLNLIDGGLSTFRGGSNHAMDFNAYLNFLSAHNHNFIRGWTPETGAVVDTGELVEPSLYVRTGPGNGLDGRPKFNLNQLNQAYFDRLRQRAVAASARGIYLSVMLFDSWGVGGYYPWFTEDTVWSGHPFNAANNINGVNGDPSGDLRGVETHSLQIPAVTAFQDAYVRKVVDTLNDLDNVLYEICNESMGPNNRDWQQRLVNLIKSREAGLPKQHPVGMTAYEDGGGNWNVFNDLLAGPADWISPSDVGGIADFSQNPPATDGRKVILVDTDHLNVNLVEVGGDTSTMANRNWVWKCFTRGYNPIYMDELSSLTGITKWSEGPAENVRVAMGHTRTYADKINLASMTPQDGLSTTGYCLASPGSEYIAYQPGSGAFSVYLQAGTYSVEWFNTVAGSTSTSSNVAVSTGWRSFSPPSAEAALYLKVTGSGGGGTNGATFVSQSVPTSMTVGGTYSVSVTMQNSGTSTWTPSAAQKLGAQNPHDNSTWGMSRVDLSAGDAIAPGQSKTFAWTVTAPSSPGTCNFQWRMVQELVEWFGPTTPNVSVNVTGGTPPPAGLVGHWKFDEGSGSFAADASGFGNDGTMVNGAGWTGGKFGTAANLDGANDYVSAASSASINNPRTGMTVAMWINLRSAVNVYGCLAGRRWGPGWDDLWVLYYDNSDGQNRYSFGARTSDAVYVTGPSSLGDLNSWVHIAGTYDGSRIRVYRNGAEIASAALTGTIPTESSALFLGAGDNGNTGIGEYLNGAMDDVRLYDRALSASELQSLAGGSSSTTYVSDLSWTYAVSGWGPIEKDRSNGEDGGSDGSTIRLNGVSYAKGIGCHAYSEIRVPLGGQYTSFQSDIGVDDEIGGEAGGYSTIVFQVWADGVKLYDSGVMTWSSATKPVNVSVAGKQELRLIVTDAGDDIWYDHADWAGARLIR